MEQNRLDAALDRLEEVVKSRVEQPLRHLREAISYQRRHGGFDENYILKEVEDISHRDRLNLPRHFTLGEELQNLADRLMRNGPKEEDDE